MPTADPPPGVQPTPRYLWLPAGSYLWKVVGTRPAPGAGGAASPPASATALAASVPVFRPAPTTPDPTGRSGGRFDPTPDYRYPYTYAALDDLTALCEVLLRDVGFDAPRRYLPPKTVTNRRLRLVLLETLRPLCLVSLLDAADLAAACQDTWLVHAEPKEYARTQRWAHWLHQNAPGPDGAGPPAGLVWPSKRQPTGRAVLLFGDRCAGAVVPSAFGARPLDDRDGFAWLGRRLSELNTRLGPPPRPAPAASPAPPTPLGPAAVGGSAR